MWILKPVTTYGHQPSKNKNTTIQTILKTKQGLGIELGIRGTARPSLLPKYFTKYK